MARTSVACVCDITWHWREGDVTSSGLLFVSEATIESDGKDAFVVYNGVRIAKRGQPNSPEAGTWVSLEPGFRVTYKGYPAELVIERDGKIIKTVW